VSPQGEVISKVRVTQEW